MIPIITPSLRPFTTWSSASTSTAPGNSSTGAWTLSNVNLTANRTPGGVTTSVTSIDGTSAGSIYWETLLDAAGSDNITGIIKSGDSINAFLGNTTNGYGYSSTAHLYNNGGNTAATVASLAAADVVGHALNMDIGAYWVSKGGVWQNGATISEVQNGTTTHAVATSLAGTWYPAVSNGAGSGAAVQWTINFGGSAFAFTVPTGFGLLR